DLASRRGDGEVVDRRVIEGAWIGQDSRDAALLELTEVLQSVWRAALVVDDEQLEVPVGGLLLDALDALLEQLQLVAGRNDDRDERRTLHLTSDPVRVGHHPVVDGGLRSGRGKRIADGTEPRDRGVWLLAARRRRGPGNAPPVIKNEGKVPDPLRG